MNRCGPIPTPPAASAVGGEANYLGAVASFVWRRSSSFLPRPFRAFLSSMCCAWVPGMVPCSPIFLPQPNGGRRVRYFPVVHQSTGQGRRRGPDR